MTDSIGIDIAASASKADIVDGILMLVRNWNSNNPDCDFTHKITDRDGTLSVEFSRPPAVPAGIAADLAKLGYRLPTL